VFKLVAPFEPAGGSAASDCEADGRDFVRAPHQTLLGVTGSGKTFTMANVIRNVNKPTLVISHNKTLAAQLYSEFKGFFRRTRSSISSATSIIINRRLTSHARTRLSRRTRA
jgi:excinuclease ABC subunit B